MSVNDDKAKAMDAILAHVQARLVMLQSIKPLDAQSKATLWHRSDELRQVIDAGRWWDDSKRKRNDAGP